MNKKRVFVIQPVLQPAAAAVLRDNVELIELPGDTPAEASAALDDALNAEIAQIHATFGYGRITADMIARAAQLEVIILPSSGAETVDLAAATARGIPVVTAAGAAYTPVAEHVIGLALSMVKRISIPDREVHATKHQRPNRELLTAGIMPSVLWRKTIGIIGFGFIGRALAQKCIHGFEMNVLAYDPFYDWVEAERQGVTLVDLDTVLRESDIVSVNAPLTAQTEQLIGAAELGAMKTSAYLINCARGPLVHTDALVDALRSGGIAGAGLDVTDPEPLPDDHPLFDLDNVVLTPHIGGVAGEFMPRMAEQAARDGLAVLRGERVYHVANPEVWPAFFERTNATVPAAGR
jgi:phosphoglycerate dehydrogenase-like enzyme